MDGAKRTLLGTWIFLFSLTAFAETPYEYWSKKLNTKQRRPSATTLVEQVEKIKIPSPEKWSVILPTFVVHGIKPTQQAYTVMPRKMDEGGTSVVTPGVGIEYKGESGLMFLAAFIKDCYDNPAGTLQIGKLYDLSDRTHFGWSMGVYSRQTPYACDRPSTDPFAAGNSCYELDNYNWKFMGSVNGVNVDIIPMPFLHFSTALYKSRGFQVDLKIMSNVVLNEIGIGIPF